jgi:hypothetical protein
MYNFCMLNLAVRKQTARLSKVNSALVYMNAAVASFGDRSYYPDIKQ